MADTYDISPVKGVTDKTELHSPPPLSEQIPAPLHWAGSIGAPSTGAFFGQYLGVDDGNITWNGGTDLFVKSITAWYNNDEWGMYGIQFEFWNGVTTPRRGKAIHTTSQFTLSRGETIVRCVQWGNGNGKRCGRVQLWTSNNRSWDVGKNTDGQTSYPMDVFSGILVGGWGTSGDNIDSLGFIYLGNVNYIRYTNLKYSEPILDYGEIEEVQLDEKEVDNSGSSDPTTWKLENDREVTTEWAMTTSTELTFGQSITVSGDIPLVAKVSETTSFSLQHTSSQTTKKSETYKLVWSLSGTVAAGKKKIITILAGSGTIARLPFTVDVVMSVDSDLLNFTENGSFSGVSYTKTYSKVLDIE